MAEVEQTISDPPATDEGEDVELAAGKLHDSEDDDDSSSITKEKGLAINEKGLNEPDETGYIETDPPMRETCIRLGNTGEMRFNHVTSIIGMVVLWGMAAWCMSDPIGSRLQLRAWKAAAALNFTWLYIGTRPVFFFFVLYVAYRYGDIRLGAPDSRPEFSNMSYFTMLFAAGIAVGLFFYGVSEPLWNLNDHWFANADYRTQDELSQFAMAQTLHHWGLAAWAGYVLVALAVGLAAYRFKLPMTLRSTLYPILGRYTWGWIGDVIDGFTIVVTVAGVCTSLGLGAMQIMAGLQRVGWVSQDISDSQREQGLIGVIWVVTLVATISVVSGLEVGIKLLSNIAFYLGQLLLLWTFILDNSSYILNLIVQCTGYYFQYSILLMSFWTDAFGQLRAGEGRAVDDQAAAAWWMDAWTVFYMAWWTSWSGFVGIFIARISKGRTVFEVCIYGTFVPMAYILIWFCVFGGVGLRQHRQALELQELGTEYYGDVNTFLQPGSYDCYDVPQNDITFNETLVFTNNLIGVTPVCKFNSTDPDNAWFNVLYSYSYPNDYDHGYGTFLSIVSIIAVGLYFVTSSDSGSLIVDHLASNGREHHHWIQRIFWAFTEGGVASALLIAGGTEALQALQAASIIAGLPFTIIMCYQMQSVLIMCNRARENPHSQVLDFSGEYNEFKTPIYGGIFNIFEWILSLSKVHPRRVELGIATPAKSHVSGFFIGLLLPMLPLYRILQREFPANSTSNLLLSVLYAFCFVGWLSFFIATVASDSLRAFGWTCLVVNAMILVNLKSTFRQKYNLHGNTFGDIISSLFFYPQVLVQIEEEQLLGVEKIEKEN